MEKNIKFNKNDLNILAILLDNSRMNNKEIAKRVHCTTATVINRKKFLEMTGVIKRYLPIIDFTKLGFETPLFLISLRDSTAQKKILEYLATFDEVGWCVSAFGPWQILFSAFVKYPRDMIILLDKVYRKFAKQIRDSRIVMVSKVIDKRGRPVMISSVKSSSEIKLSKKERQILMIFEEDCPLPFSKISMRLGINYTVFKRTVERLIECGVIRQFSCQIDYAKLNYHQYSFFIRLKKRSESNFLKATKFLSNLEGLHYLKRLVGYYDFHVEVMVKKEIDVEKVIEYIYENFGNMIDGFEYLILGEEHKLSYLPKLE